MNIQNLKYSTQIWALTHAATIFISSIYYLIYNTQSNDTLVLAIQLIIGATALTASLPSVPLFMIFRHFSFSHSDLSENSRLIFETVFGVACVTFTIGLLFNGNLTAIQELYPYSIFYIIGLCFAIWIQKITNRWSR